MQKLVLVASLLVPIAASADKRMDDIKKPDATAAFTTWTPAQQWMMSDGDRVAYGYASEVGALLLADELGDKLSEAGRVSMLDECFGAIYSNAELANSLIPWAICGEDVKKLDLKKLDAELAAEGIGAEERADAIKDATAVLDKAKKYGEKVDAAAKDDPGVALFLKTAADGRAEWAAWIGKNKPAYDQYLALKDGVRSNKSNNAAFKGCETTTGPAFAKLVKATAPKIPWDVGRDYLPSYTDYMTATIDGYMTTVSYAACAWSHHESGEAIYAAAANHENGNPMVDIHGGPRTHALTKFFAATFKPKFADRSIGGDWMTSAWKTGVSMSGVNAIAAIMTPSDGVIGTLKADGDVTKVGFKGDKVEACLQWADSNKVKSISSGGDVQYDKKCLKRGMVDNQTTAVEVPTRYLQGAKVGDNITIVRQFPVVAWKGKKLTMLLGVKL